MLDRRLKEWDTGSFGKDGDPQSKVASRQLPLQRMGSGSTPLAAAVIAAASERAPLRRLMPLAEG